MNNPSNAWHNKSSNIPLEKAVSLTPDILRVLEETREWAMEELDAVWDYPVEIKKENSELILLPTNFKVDTTWWKELDNWGKVLVNESWDILEHLEWDFKWEQFYTQKAAIRETAKYNLRIPTLEEWWIIIKKYVPDIDMSRECLDNWTTRLSLWMELSWYNAMYDTQNREWWKEWHYWSSSPLAWIRVKEDYILPNCTQSDLFMLPVKCLKWNSKAWNALEKIKKWAWDQEDLDKIEAIKVIDDDHLEIAGLIHRVWVLNTISESKWISYDKEWNCLYDYNNARDTAFKFGYRMYSRTLLEKLISALPWSNKWLARSVFQTLFEIPYADIEKIAVKYAASHDFVNVWVESTIWEAFLLVDKWNDLLRFPDIWKNTVHKYLLVHK